jgi:hypothetical protein
MAAAPRKRTKVGSPSLSAQASVSAAARTSISGKWGRLELSDIIYCSIFSLIFVASLVGLGFGIAYCGAFAFLSFAAIVGLCINRNIQSTREPSGPIDTRMAIYNGESGAVVEASLPNGRIAFQLMRDIFQNRGPVPIPDGRIMGADASDPKNIVRYSEEEKAQVAQELERAVRQQEEQLYLQLREEVEHLRLSVSPPPQRNEEQ